MLAACGRSHPPEYIPAPPEPEAHVYTEEARINDTPLLLIPSHDDYVVTLEVDPEARTIYGISQIEFTNRSGEELEEIVLRVFLNALEAEKEPHMEIEYASLNHETLEFRLDSTVLTLDLPEPILPDVTVSLLLQYSAYVPEMRHFMGGNEAGMWMGMLLPLIAVHDNNGWNTDPLYTVGGASVMRDTSNFQVAVTTPMRYIVVGTGLRTEETIDDTDTKITRFSADMVRDFAFAILSPYYERVSTTTASGTEVKFLFYSEVVAQRAEEILEWARDAMEYFEYRVGTYPFGQLSIVETDMAFTSIPLSQVVFTDTVHLRHSNFMQLTASIGSQWFSVVAGNNPIREPWLDTGLSRFITTSMFHPDDFSEHMRQEHYALSERTDIFIYQGMNYYMSRGDFITAQGRKPMLMLYALMRRVGEETFWEIIRQYYQEFSFRIATVEDFISISEEVHGRSLQEFFDTWMLYGTTPRLR